MLDDAIFLYIPNCIASCYNYRRGDIFSIAQPYSTVATVRKTATMLNEMTYINTA